MRLIDADALSEKLSKTTIFIKDGEVFQRMINDAPTVSAETHDKRTETHGVCSDLISRADAIEAVEDNSYGMGSRASIKAIKALPSAEAVQGWIPCSERLPEKDKLVLVTVWNDVSVAWRNIYGRWESAEDMYEKGDVTAWMQLPEPYKEDDKE